MFAVKKPILLLKNAQKMIVPILAPLLWQVGSFIVSVLIIHLNCSCIAFIINEVR